MAGKVSNWTKTQVIECAEQCETRSEFRDRFPEAYDAACINLWIDDVFLLLEDDDPQPWPLESLKREAAKYKDLASFAAGSPGAYITARDRKLLDDVCGHM